VPAPDFEAGAGVPEVLIRGCELEDFEEVLSLLGQLWSDLELDAAASREVFGRLLEKDNCVLTCAVAEGRVVGFCDFNVRHSLWKQGKLAYVDELVVEEGFRGRGVGAALLAEAARQTRELGCARIELDSALHRAEAHRFYDGLGWERRALLFGKDLA
jgi:glucosamine-phosphate N-acetyltransferase